MDRAEKSSLMIRILEDPSQTVHDLRHRRMVRGERAMEGEALDVGVDVTGEVGREMLFEGGPAALYPPFSDVAELRAPGGDRVQLVVEDQIAGVVADAAHDDAGDRSDHRPHPCP